MKHFISFFALLLMTVTGAWAEDIEVDGGSRTISSDVSSDYFYMYGGTLTIDKGATVTLSDYFYFDEGSNIYLHGTLQGGAGLVEWHDGCVIHIYLNDGAKYTLSGVTAPSDACQIYYGYDAATDGNGTVSVKNGAVEVTSSSTGYKSTTYTFTASPNSGYKFKNWTKGAGGEVLGTDASINVTCEQNGQYQVYANFEEGAPAATLYNLTLADGSSDHGTVAFTVGGNAATQAKKDDVVTVSVTPNDGYLAEDVTVRAYTSWEAASEILTGGGENPELVSDITVSKNTENGTWTFTMPEANVWVVVTYVVDMTALDDAISEAEAYYNSISESNPDAAAALQTAINAAKAVKDNADATQEEIETAAQTLTDALNAAKADVALKRITLVIPAKSYMARIDADKRQIENAVDGVNLYSVNNVTNTEVELTGELSVIAAEMPYFIYNDNDTEVEVSIIVSSEDADNVQYDSEHFKGTLVDKTFTDEDMEEADHYVLSGGSSFVWVKDAGVLSAGKCWIELPKSANNARALSIVFEGETTGINAVSSSADKTDGEWYDLSGRRVAQPAKGIYVKNGRKVIVK